MGQSLFFKIIKNKMAIINSQATVKITAAEFSAKY